MRSIRAAGILVLVAALVGCSDSGANVEAVRDYAAALKPHQREGGRIVVELIKPRLADLTFGRMRPEAFREEAASWRAAMSAVRERIAAIEAPVALREVKRLLDLAMGQYLEAIDAFVAASRSAPKDLADAVSRASAVAESADRTYDRAGDMLQRELRRVLPEAS